MNKKTILIGSGGHARVVIDSLKKLKYDLIGIVDINYNNIKEKILDVPVLGNLEILDKFNRQEISLHVSIGDCNIRNKVFHKLKKSDFSFQNIIDPDAIVSKFVIFGNSIFVNAGAILNAKVILKDNVIINTSAILEHEVEINSHSHIGPKALICGRSKIGSNTFIGAGATIIDKINIGSNCIIGAGSVVINDVGSFEKVAGNPAKKI